MINQNELQDYVERNIGLFHERRIQSLATLKLNQVLKRKNPYLFKAKHVLTAEGIVKGLVDAHTSSLNEETLFCNDDGAIDWPKLVEFNSARDYDK